VNDTRPYLIRLEGLVSNETINANSPIEALVMQMETFTRCAVCTDQSGLIGLLRHLHARGLMILSVTVDLE
jgi:hypothetical protein